MKLFFKLSQYGWLIAGSVLLMSVCSCEKIKEAGDSVTALWADEEETSDGSDANAEVVSVNRKEGEAIIADESRVVIVEYYSDT